MKTKDINIDLAEIYFELLKNLSSGNKLKLIAMLSNSITQDKNEKIDSLKLLYGAFISDKSADEIINEIKQSKTFSRKQVEF